MKNKHKRIMTTSKKDFDSDICQFMTSYSTFQLLQNFETSGCQKTAKCNIVYCSSNLIVFHHIKIKNEAQLL